MNDRSVDEMNGYILLLIVFDSLLICMFVCLYVWRVYYCVQILYSFVCDFFNCGWNGSIAHYHYLSHTKLNFLYWGYSDSVVTFVRKKIEKQHTGTTIYINFVLKVIMAKAAKGGGGVKI